MTSHPAARSTRNPFVISTGGRAFAAAAERPLYLAPGRISRFTQAALALLSAFLPALAPAGTGKDTFHTVQLDAPGIAATLRTRTGFYAR